MPLDPINLSATEDGMSKPLNIRFVAVLLSADLELDDVERQLKRIGKRRLARQITDVRDMLAAALAAEQEGLALRFADYALSVEPSPPAKKHVPAKSRRTRDGVSAL
jgi:hypothetical protein